MKKIFYIPLLLFMFPVFKTYAEQIKILKNKYKLNIKNEDIALELLSTISYYDLINGYKESFFEKSENCCD